jgi:hypothetical protein
MICQKDNPKVHRNIRRKHNLRAKTVHQIPVKSVPLVLKTYRPDVDCPQNDLRVPQEPRFADMWIRHLQNFGNVKDPL